LLFGGAMAGLVPITVALEKDAGTRVIASAVVQPGSEQQHKHVQAHSFEDLQDQ